MQKGMRAVICLALLWGLTSCLQRTRYDFNTHPSVLRGDWAGTVENFPGEGDATVLRLLDLQATFIGSEFGSCDGFVLCRYRFSGTMKLGADTEIAIAGYGDAGNGGIYHQDIYQQSKGPTPPGFSLEADWNGRPLVIVGVYGDYRSGTGEAPPLPTYASQVAFRDEEGRITTEYPFNLVLLAPPE